MFFLLSARLITQGIVVQFLCTVKTFVKKNLTFLYPLFYNAFEVIAVANREVFQKNLVELMAQHGGNQNDLAEYVGVSKQTVSAWMHGKAYPRADVMERISSYFGITISALVFDKQEQMEESELVYFFHALPEEGKMKLLERTNELAILYGIIRSDRHDRS